MFSAPSAAIAQLDRASDYGSEGLRFDSSWLHHSQSEILTFFSGLPFICRFSGDRSSSTDELLKVYQQAKQKSSKFIAWNPDKLTAMTDTDSALMRHSCATNPSAQLAR
jgi:hypothetical protein